MPRRKPSVFSPTAADMNRVNDVCDALAEFLSVDPESIGYRLGDAGVPGGYLISIPLDYAERLLGQLRKESN